MIELSSAAIKNSGPGDVIARPALFFDCALISRILFAGKPTPPPFIYADPREPAVSAYPLH